MRKTKKTLSLLLALAMVLTLFAGVAQASASVRITSTTAVLIPGSNRVLGTVTIAYDTAIGIHPIAANTATVVTVTLPSGVTWDADDITAATTTPAGIWTRERVDAQTAIFRATSTPAITGLLTILTRADIASDFRGDILATVAVRSESFDATQIFWEQSETERLGRVAATGTTSTAPSPTNVVRGVGNQSVSDIRIRENIHGSLTDGADITIALPSGVTFANIVGATIVSPSTATTTVPSDAALQTITLSTIRLNVGPNVPDGPIIVTISGANATAATVTVATVGVVGAVTVAPRNAPADPITAGRLGEQVADIRLTENIAGALMPNRTISLTLPVGFTWNEVAEVSGDDFIVGTPDISDGGRTLTYWTPPTLAGGRYFDIDMVRINTRIDAPAGDIVVTVGGTAGASGTAVLGTLRRPVTVTAVTVPNVRADATGQALGNIVISEAFVGAIRTGTIELTLPSGFTFDGTPTVTISDVVGTEPSITSAMALLPTNTTASVTLAAAVTPTNAATITFSGIRVNSDRLMRVVFGPLNVNVRGSAILEPIATAAPNVVGVSNVSHGAAVGDNIATVTAANVVSATARRTVFTIDSTAFTVDGVVQPPLDVAPVIVDERTMMPIRAAANAAGVTNDRILFNAGVITIMGDNRIAQFTLGSRVMLVNNTVIPMSVAPALVANRALIPVRYVAAALGVPIAWDVTARTVTVSVQ